MDLTDEPLDTTTFADAGNQDSDYETDADDEVTFRQRETTRDLLLERFY